MMHLFNKFRLLGKKMFDQISNERIRKNLLQAIPFWIGAVITGLFAVLYAKLFSWAEEGSLFVLHHYSWALFLLAPVCFLLAWWVVKQYAPYARGSGIPQVIAAIELTTPRYHERVSKLLSLRIIVVKTISSCIMVLGGGVVGREGPTIQIAGSIFRKVYQWLPAWWPKISRRNMVLTGAAAGLAAAFNTPLGGFVFTVEELTKTHVSFFRTALFTAIIIAGLTAQALLGPYLYLGYPDLQHLSPYIFFGVILVAVIAGLGGSAMAKLILAIMNWKKKFSTRKQLTYLLVCAFVIAAFAFFMGSIVLGSGKELMTQTLFTSEKTLPWYTPLVRIAGSVMSFTTGAAGGVFAPALGSGAGIGAVIAGWMHLAPANANILILAGMVAFLTGVTRTPFTSAILVLEMTDRHNVIFHLMLAAMVASLAAVLIDRHSFYDHLKLNFIHELHQVPEERPDAADHPAAEKPETTNGPTSER